MVCVKFLPRAEQDLFHLPEKIQQEILRKTKMPAQFPHLGQRMGKSYSNYRYLLAGRNKFRIIYRVKSEILLEIAYIRHCKRQMGLRVIHA